MNKRKKAYIISLIFPLIVFLSSLIFLFITCGFSLKEYSIWGWGVLSSPFIGGILPAALTVSLRTDTSSYIRQRIILLIISVVFCAFSWLLTLYCFTEWIILCIPIIMIIATTVYFSFKSNCFKEWLIIFLSNPIMYYLIVIIELIIDISKSEFSFIG